MTKPNRIHALDGLRALAVALVVFAHTGVPGFSGGWIGVDVFFVLSGYLITHVLLQQDTQQPFHYQVFLARRMRRLAPAFVATGALSLLVFAAVLPDRVFLPAAQTLAWSALGAGNIQQSLGSSYFSDDGALNPYTHLWSLGVEEQFYLAFPFLFFVLKGWKRPVVLACLGLASYLLLKEHQQNPAAYFWPWTRSWGLVMGVMLAMALHHRPGARAPGWVGDLGVLAILGATFMGNKDGVEWPFFALVAAAGAVAFIGSKTGSFGKVLSWKPIVMVGIASYSIYLVHQPILVLAHVWTGGYPIGAVGQAAAIVAVTCAGLAMRRWVEEPFLEGKQVFGLRRGVIGHLALFALAYAASAGYWTAPRTALAHTWGGGVSIEQRITANVGESPYPEGYSPFNKEATKDSNLPNVHLWGDSHAMHYAQAIQAAGIPHQQWTLSVCAPSDGIALIDGGGDYGIDWAKKCARLNREVLDFLLAQKTPGTVIMVSAMWMVDRKNTRAWDDRTHTEIHISHGYDRVARALEAPARALRAKGWNVVTITPNIRWQPDPGRCNAIMAWTGRDASVHCAFPRLSNTLESERQEKITGILQHYEDIGLTRHVDTMDVLCPDNLCLTERDGLYIWRDKAHIAREGSAWLGRQEAFRKSIRAAVYGGTKN